MLLALKRSFAAVGLLFVSVCFAADHTVSLIAQEWAAETSTIITRLPESVPSRIDAKQCVECTALTLNVTRNTKFLLGKTAVTLDELRQVARGNYPMGVFYEPESKNVTRIIIYVTPPGVAR